MPSHYLCQWQRLRRSPAVRRNPGRPRRGNLDCSGDRVALSCRAGAVRLASGRTGASRTIGAGAHDMKCCPICDREYAEDLSRCPQDGAILRRPAPKFNQFEGQIIKGRYRVISKLGQGGMGSVYLAEQKWMARQVALKILNEDLAQDDAQVTRFRLEARLAGNLDHRNITRVYDFDQT